jgi:hypothetical protein
MCNVRSSKVADKAWLQQGMQSSISVAVIPVIQGCKTLPVCGISARSQAPKAQA